MSFSHPDTHLAVHALRHDELVRQARLYSITTAAAATIAARAAAGPELHESPAVPAVIVPRQRSWRGAVGLSASRTD